MMKAAELKHAHFNVIYAPTLGHSKKLIFSYKGIVRTFEVEFYGDPDYWDSVLLDGELFDLNFYSHEPLSLTIYSLKEDCSTNTDDYLNLNFLIKS